MVLLELKHAAMVVVDGHSVGACWHELLGVMLWEHSLGRSRLLIVIIDQAIERRSPYSGAELEPWLALASHLSMQICCA